MFCIIVISVASPKKFVVQYVLFKTLTVVLQYLRDAFSHVCILAEKKEDKVLKLGSHFLLICAKAFHQQDLSTASLNRCSYLTKECSIYDEIFSTPVNEMQHVSFLDVYCNLQCILTSKDTECC